MTASQKKNSKEYTKGLMIGGIVVAILIWGGSVVKKSMVKPNDINIIGVKSPAPSPVAQLVTLVGKVSSTTKARNGVVYTITLDDKTVWIIQPKYMETLETYDVIPFLGQRVELAGAVVKRPVTTQQEGLKPQAARVITPGIVSINSIEALP